MADITLTKKAVALIQRKARLYNWYTEHAADGEDNKNIAEDYYLELVAIFDMLKALGFKIDEDYRNTDTYDMLIQRIAIYGKNVFTG